MKFFFRRFSLVAVVILIQSYGAAGDSYFSSNTLGDGCDWTGSGLTDYEGPGRGVTPVYLRCSQGHLEWSYPRGALRVILRLGATGREFRGCIKLGGSFGTARVFLEGPRSLVSLFALDDGGAPQIIRCFQSREAQAALYIEASPDVDKLKRVVAEFFYHLDPVPRGRTIYDSEEDCRPCNPDEMIRLYCTSDFVARGSITGIYNNEDYSRSEISVSASKVYRQLQTVFTRPGEGTADPRHPLKNLSKTEYHAYNDGSHHMLGTLHVPIQCGATHGAGEFLFMGRYVLGEPVLTCAPRLEDWIQVRAQAIEKGEPQCSLDT